MDWHFENLGKDRITVIITFLKKRFGDPLNYFKWQMLVNTPNTNQQMNNSS